jgi:hypothetical protein
MGGLLTMAKPKFFKRGGKLLTNTMLCRYALEINIYSSNSYQVKLI